MRVRPDRCALLCDLWRRPERRVTCCCIMSSPGDVISDDNASSEPSRLGRRSLDDDTDGLALAPSAKCRRPSAQLAYAIIDGRVTQVQVATAADLAAAVAADAGSLSVDNNQMDDDMDGDNSLEVRLPLKCARGGRPPCVGLQSAAGGALALLIHSRRPGL